jgi:tetratricopeptide (TPR) repeat protein
MKQVVMAGLVTATLLGAVEPLAAQDFIIYMPPNCELDTQHFLVRNAELYVKAATEARSEDQQIRSVADAKRVLMDALDGGEEANPAVWYFLGRVYALEYDLPGVDSAYTKAEALFPECSEDIDNQRRFIWVPLYNEGAEALSAGDLAVAREAFTKADQVSNNEPFIPYYLASVLVQEGNNAAALPLFKKTLAMGQTEGEYEESYVTSLFNSARLHHMLRQWDSAVVWYGEYRKVNPEDREAITGMLQVLEAGGRGEEALAFTDTLLAYASVLTDVDLFSAGVALFQADRFDDAVGAFTAGLDKNSHYRDGIYNLAQSYFALANPGNEEDGPEPTPEEQERRNEAARHMLEVSQHLVDVDPSSENALRLLAAAHQLNGDTTSTLDLLDRIEALRFDVRIDSFDRTESGAQVRGTISNLKEEETTVAEVRFEFLDAAGQVVTMETVSGTTLTSKASSPFQFNPVGEGIVAWRYRTEG